MEGPIPAGSEGATKVILVNEVPLHISQEALVEFFQTCSKVESAEVIAETEEFRTYKLTFETSEEAISALMLDQAILGDVPIKTSLFTEITPPPDTAPTAPSDVSDAARAPSDSEEMEASVERAEQPERSALFDRATEASAAVVRAGGALAERTAPARKRLGGMFASIGKGLGALGQQVSGSTVANQVRSGAAIASQRAAAFREETLRKSRGEQ